MSLPRFYVKIDTSIKYMTDKVHQELEQALKQIHRPKAVTVLGSGQAIEVALKISNEICKRFPNGLHRTTNSYLHLTDTGESLQQENIIDKEKLSWLLRGD